jgi:hypothetical protein
MKTKKTYLTDEELRDCATSTPHKFLNFRIKKLLEKGWNVKSVRNWDDVYVVVVYNNTIAAGKYALSIVYPNGLMRTVHDKKISWSWDDAKNYASATEPTPGLDYSE